jgi:hypothetical protein
MDGIHVSIIIPPAPNGNPYFHPAPRVITAGPNDFRYMAIKYYH